MRRSIRPRHFAAAIAALCCATCLNFTAALARADTIVNGGFEAGNFSGWTQGGDQSFTIVVSFGTYAGITGPHSGAAWAALGPDISDGTLDQTVTVTAGSNYEFGFWLANNGETPSRFAASFDGTTVLSLTNIPAQDWTHYSFPVTPAGSTANVRFTFFDDPSHLGLDDVSLTDASSPVPLPSASGAGMALMIGWGSIKRRRSRRMTAR